MARAVLGVKGACRAERDRGRGRSQPSGAVHAGKCLQRLSQKSLRRSEAERKASPTRKAGISEETTQAYPEVTLKSARRSMAALQPAETRMAANPEISAAPRKAIQEASIAVARPTKAERLQAFRELQRLLNLTPERAASWQDAIGEARR